MCAVAIGFFVVPGLDVLEVTVAVVTTGDVQFWIGFGPMPGTKPGTFCVSRHTIRRASAGAVVESKFPVAICSAALRVADSTVIQAW
ncbi:MAG: hypothetical protein M3P14_00370 [Chloroflexota bacterium]|nr:hypothetical protein [Chloroflexota bacterium]